MWEKPHSMMQRRTGSGTLAGILTEEEPSEKSTDETSAMQVGQTRTGAEGRADSSSERIAKAKHGQQDRTEKQPGERVHQDEDPKAQ